MFNETASEWRHIHGVVVHHDEIRVGTVDLSPSVLFVHTLLTLIGQLVVLLQEIEIANVDRSMLSPCLT